MNSGIYALTWKSGKFYIGKSEDIERRWKEHANSFLKGKHAKAMQEVYNREGPPEYEVLHYVHSDHIDLYEGIIINEHINNADCLNTTKGKAVDIKDKQTLAIHISGLGLESTAQHMRSIEACVDTNIYLEDKLSKAENKITQLNNQGIVLPIEELEERKKLLKQFQTQQKDLEEAYTLMQRLTKKVQFLQNRTLWQRILNVKE